MTGPVDATLREAAIAAIRTGLGRGEDARKVKNKERVTWRARGRAWLRQDLERLRSARKSDDFGKRALAVAELYMTLTHPELASVRDEAALAHLPDEEADAWRALWSDVRLAARP
jgi:hypothetical protein